MSAHLIDGRQIADGLRGPLEKQVQELRVAGRRVCLSAVLIGRDPAAESFARSCARAAEGIGVEYRLLRLPESILPAEAGHAIDGLNRDPSVGGIQLHVPLPPGLDAFSLQQRIAPHKDVEGVAAANLGLLTMGRPAQVPCTAAAAFECIRATGLDLAGAHAVIVGRSTIVGKPVAALLLAAHATVTLCHTRTRGLAEHTQRADVLVVAAGQAGLIGAEHVRPGAVVIDVGTNEVAGPPRRIVGDVRFDEVRETAGWITPVPGGVGPLTVIMLLRNVVEAVRPGADAARLHATC